MIKVTIITIIVALVESINIQSHDLVKLGLNPKIDSLDDCRLFYRGWLLAITCSSDALGMASSGQILVADIHSVFSQMEPNYYITNKQVSSIYNIYITGENSVQGSG